MKMELDGKEVLYVLFGFPALIAAIIWLTTWVAQPKIVEHEYAPAPVVEGGERPITINAELKLPEGAVVVNNANNIPAPEIHNHEKEIIEREKLVAPGKIEVAFSPKIEWYGEVTNNQAPMVQAPQPVKKEIRDLKPSDPRGELLPPPKP